MKDADELCRGLLRKARSDCVAQAGAERSSAVSNHHDSAKHAELRSAPAAMQGDTAKARAAYQDFLTLWKDADPDIPILKQAKAEYAKLR